METFFWIVGIVIIFLPIVLTFFSIFLMLTWKVSDDDVFEDGSWGQDIDQMAKRHYKSNT